ncbi:MDC1 protein, partial [Dasyornis broadbenti]|nr:MDC1 protein [Dasyornis broadbenti]
AVTPDPDVGGPGSRCGAPVVGTDPDVEEEEPNPDVAASERPKSAPKGPEIPDVEGPRSPHLDPDVDTQLFLPPDPDVQVPDPDVGHPESPKAALDEPGIPDVEQATPDPDVGGGPGPAPEEEEAPPTPQVRRSRRLAESRGGGASAGPSPAEKGRDQAPKPRPSPKPRPQRRCGQTRVGLDEAPPSASIKGSGRGSVTALPPQEEEQPAGGAKLRLRPRAAPGPAPIRVLFTGLVASRPLLVALGTLGGTEATSVHDCSHLVTDGIRRTLKFLCALARGIPIVTPEWLIQSSRSGRALSPGPFLPQDPPC